MEGFPDKEILLLDTRERFDRLKLNLSDDYENERQDLKESIKTYIPNKEVYPLYLDMFVLGVNNGDAERMAERIIYHKEETNDLRPTLLSYEYLYLTIFRIYRTTTSLYDNVTYSRQYHLKQLNEHLLELFYIINKDLPENNYLMKFRNGQVKYKITINPDFERLFNSYMRSLTEKMDDNMLDMNQLRNRQLLSYLNYYNTLTNALNGELLSKRLPRELIFKLKNEFQ